MAATPTPPAILMVGAGEYNVGYVPTAAGAAADKRCGVTAIVLFDLRRRGRVGRVLLADADGRRLPLARACMDEKIGAYRGMDTAVDCFPRDESGFDAGAAEAARRERSELPQAAPAASEPMAMAGRTAALRSGQRRIAVKGAIFLIF